MDISHKYEYIYLKIMEQNHSMNEKRPMRKVTDSEIFVVLSEWYYSDWFLKNRVHSLYKEI